MYNERNDGMLSLLQKKDFLSTSRYVLKIGLFDASFTCNKKAPNFFHGVGFALFCCFPIPF